MDAKKVIMLMVVVVVICICLYFMSTVSFNTQLQNAHTLAGATGTVVNPVSLGFDSSLKEHKIILFDQQTGDINDTVTLGNIMQNAYYLAENSYLTAKASAKQYTDTSFSNVGFNTSVPNQHMQTNIQNLNQNVAAINAAMTGNAYANIGSKGTVLKGTAKLSDFTGKSSKFMRKEHPYKIQPMSSGAGSNQAQAGTYLLTSFGRDIDVWGQRSKDLGFVRAGGASGRPFQFLEMVGNPDGTTAAQKGDWA